MPKTTTPVSDPRETLIRKLGLLQALAAIGMWLWPLLTLGMWLFLEYVPVSEIQRMAGGINPGLGASVIHTPTAWFTITWKVKALGMCVSLFPAAIQFLFMRQWVALFGLYRQGRIFETENVKCFARMGRTLLALSIYDIVFSMPLNSLALTASNPPGKHMISFGLTTSHVPVLATGVALVVIAWVMDEGRKLRQEADLVV